MGGKQGKRKSLKRKKKVQVRPVWVALGLLLLSALILLPHWLHKDSGAKGAPVPEGYRHFMVDISHHNPRGIAWDSLRVVIGPDGCTTRNLMDAKAILPLSHVVMKATEGESLKDRHFDLWWTAAGAAGLSRGAYHFFRSSKDARLQAQSYISRVTLTHRDLPPVLDIETVHRGCTREELNRKALEWLRLVQAHYGRTPIVYTSDSFAREWLSRDILDTYPLWIARYNTAPPQTAGWQYWQFTDRAVVYGIGAPVDLSVLL